MKLAKKVVGRCAAIHAHHLRPYAGVFFHCVGDITSLVGNGFKCRTDDMVAARATRDPHYRSASIRIPVGRAQPYKRGHEIDATRAPDL